MGDGRERGKGHPQIPARFDAPRDAMNPKCRAPLLVLANDGGNGDGW
jgi:hypothetical protein